MPTNRAFTKLLRKGSGDIAIFVPFTRLRCVTRFFAALLGSDVPLERCRIVVYVDSADPFLYRAVETVVQALPFAEIVIHYTAWAPPAEFARSRERRGRHSAMRTASCGLIPKADYLLLLEDDTLIPSDSWAKLTAGLEAGFDWVSGFEVGRWGATCPGLWRLTSTRREAATPGTGLERVDATGVYLVLTTPELYCSRKWDVWDNAWGHDVSITWQMTKDGYRLGVDWSLECIHMTENGDLTCDMATPLIQQRQPHQPVAYGARGFAPLTAFPKVGPNCIKFEPPNCEVDKLRYTLGKDVTFDGFLWPKGTGISKETARAMSAVGAIAARIP